MRRSFFLFQMAMGLLLVASCGSSNNETAQSAVDSTSKTETVANKTATAPDVLLAKIKNKELPVLFHGFGTEPNWTIYIGKDELLYVDPLNGIKESYLLNGSFDKALKTQTISYTDKAGTSNEIKIINEPASDGMGETMYPYSVTFKAWQGAGDTTLIVDRVE